MVQQQETTDTEQTGLPGQNGQTETPSEPGDGSVDELFRSINTPEDEPLEDITQTDAATTDTEESVGVEEAPTEAEPETSAPTVKELELQQQLEVERQVREQYQRVGEEQQAELYRQKQAQVLEAQKTTVDQEVAKWREYGINQGLDETTVQPWLNQIRETRLKELETTQQAVQYGQWVQEKAKAAAEYASKYGVDFDEMWKYDSRAEMERQAQNLKKVSGLEQEIANMKKVQAAAKVPAQTYENGQATGRGRMNDLDFVRWSNALDRPLSKTEQDRADRILGIQ